MRRAGNKARPASDDYARLSLMRLEERRLLSADARFAIHALDAVKPEGNGYETPYTFEVVRTGNPHGAVRIGYAVSGVGSSPADATDFGGGFPRGELKFAPHEMRKVLVVNVAGDLEPEPDETFVVEIFAKEHGRHDRVSIVKSSARGTILNDDFAADLGITKNDCLAWAVPGTELTYTVVVSNDGPSSVWGATVQDVFPHQLLNVSYASQVTRGHASGNTSDSGGNARQIYDSVYLATGSQITYTITGTIAPTAIGWIENTATVQAPAGVRDTNPHNNTATDRTVLTPQVDLRINKTDGLKTAVPGQTQLQYTIVVTNAGPSAVYKAWVTDELPAELRNVTYTSTATGWVQGNTSAGEGSIDDLVSMAPGSSITYVVTADISPWAFGTLVNTAQVRAPKGTVDTNPDNNRVTDTTTLTPQVDLRITKTDGLKTAVPGQTQLQYTIVVTNAGPSAVYKAWVTDELPAELRNVTYTSTATGWVQGNTECGEGSIDDLVSMAPGSSITYLVTADISPFAFGTLVNTAQVRAPKGTVDTNPDNNRVTDTTELTPQVDLRITKTDGLKTAVPGQTQLQYTIVVTNAGPSAVYKAWVTDELPAELRNVTYTSTATGWVQGNTECGEGSIDDLVSMAPGSSITYLVTADISPFAFGTLVNTAQVRAPKGTLDTNPDNNRVTDTTELTPQVDLRITKTDGLKTAVPGQTQLQYTIVVTNAGPSAVYKAWVTDELPAELRNVTYTSTATGWVQGNTSAGEGSIDDLVSMAPGSSITYLVTADIAPFAFGTLVNTAQVRAPKGTLDTNPDNNRVTDTTELTPQVDLRITKTDGLKSAVPGQTQLQYTIVVTNAGPSAVQQAWVTDELPAELRNVTYTSTVTGWVQGNTSAGEGSIDDLVSMAPGSSITYVVTADISPWAFGTLVNTAQVRAPKGTVDTNPENNRATDTTELTPHVDLRITKTDGLTTAIPGQTQLQYTIAVTNAGPSAVQQAWVTDELPAELRNVTYTSTVTGWVQGNTSAGEGSIDDLVSMAPGSSITYLVTADISPFAFGTLVNTAQVRAPKGTVDTNPDNNRATDTTELTPHVDLRITKTDGLATAIPGQTQLQYTIVVTNAGPSAVRGAAMTDDVPDALMNVHYVSRSTGTASGNTVVGEGDIFDLLDLGPGDSVEYIVTADVRSSATGALVNTARIRVPAGVVDTDPSNNAATDTNLLIPQGNLSVTLSDDRSSVLPGDAITYTVVVTNTGPSDVRGATLQVVFPAGLVDVRYTSVVTTGVAGGNSANQSGQSRGINDLLDLAAQTVVTYTITGDVAAGVFDPLLFRVVLTAPPAFVDLGSGDNEAVDSNLITPQILLRTVQAILPEGNRGETQFTFLVERWGDIQQPVEIEYSVEGIGANPADRLDFSTGYPGGVLRLAAGEVSGVITLGVRGDVLFEPTKTFALTLLHPSAGVLIGPATAFGTIQDDDSLFAYAVALLEKSDKTETNDDGAAAAALLLDASTGDLAEEGAERASVTASAGGSEGSLLSRAAQRWSPEDEDLKASLGDVRLFFVQVDVSGVESARNYDLPVNMLEGDRLLGLFKKFPNGHYRVYLEQDRTLRKLYDLHIYDHQLTTPEVPAAQPIAPGDAAVAPAESDLDAAQSDSATSDVPADDRSEATAGALPSTAAALLFSARLRRPLGDPRDTRSSEKFGDHSADWSRTRRLLRELRRHVGNS